MEALYITMYVIWGLLTLAFVIIELHTQFQIGGAAAIASLFALIIHAITKGNPLWIEIVAFGVIWIVSWIIFFSFFKKIKKQHDNNDGYFAFVNKTFKADKGNEDGYGRIKINDKIYRFKSDDKIKKSDIIIVNKLKGTTMIVKKVVD